MPVERKYKRDVDLLLAEENFGVNPVIEFYRRRAEVDQQAKVV